MSDVKTAIEAIDTKLAEFGEKLPKAMPEKVDSLEQKIGNLGSSLDTKLAEFGEKLPKAIEPDEVKNAAELKEETAEMERGGALEGISKMEIWDIPLGQALIGGFSAVVLSELVDGFLAAQSSTIKGVVKLVAAGVTIKWGSKLLGRTATTAIAIILGYDGLRQLIPIDEWAGKLAGGITPATGAGLAGKAGMGNTGRNVLNQAETVARNYYPGITNRVG